MIAIHEAGHTIVSEILHENSVHLVSIRKHLGETGGFTFCHKDEEYWVDINQMKQRVMMLLGAKAATEIVFGQVDPGVSSDLDRAKRVLHRWVAEYGAFGFDKIICPFIDNTSDGTKTKIDESIGLEMEKLYAETKQIIAKNIEFLKDVANALIEKETITAKDICEIKKSHKIVK